MFGFINLKEMCAEKISLKKKKKRAGITVKESKKVYSWSTLDTGGKLCRNVKNGGYLKRKKKCPATQPKREEFECRNSFLCFSL